MARTLAEKLEAVQDAIEKIETEGQSVQVNGRLYERADLQLLYRRERHLEGLLTRKDAGGVRVRRAVPLDG